MSARTAEEIATDIRRNAQAASRNTVDRFLRAQGRLWKEARDAGLESAVRALLARMP